MYRLTAAILLVLSSGAAAEVPRVATDIAPVHGLVSQVMDGLGAPDLIVPPASSPHGYAMRPSEARALAQAELIVWVGPDLTPWLAGPLDTLAAGADRLELAQVQGVTRLPNRHGARFEGHEHEHEHEHGAAVDDADSQAEDVDPHMWLDPRNAAHWLTGIAQALAVRDPDNADRYHSNAARARQEIAALEAEIADTLAPLRGAPFVVFHDGYHYFEARFGVEAQAALTASDAAPPTAARLAEVQHVLRETGARCALAEPLVNPGLVSALGEGRQVKVAMLDPLGAHLAPGGTFYPSLLRDLAAGFADCLTPE